MDICTLSMDLMHVKWLGADSYFLGSILCYLVDYKLPGKPKENLALLWSEIQEGYKMLKTSTRFSCLTLSMIRAGKNPFPCLKGKAAEVKGLVPVLARVTRQYLNDTDLERLMYKGLMQSMAIDQCLTENVGLSRFNLDQKFKPPLCF